LQSHCLFTFIITFECIECYWAWQSVESTSCVYLVCCIRLHGSVNKPKGIATDCSLIASSRSSLPLNASSAIGLDKASRERPVSILGLLRPRIPIRWAVSLPLRVHHYLLMHRVLLGLTKRREHIMCLFGMLHPLIPIRDQAGRNRHRLQSHCLVTFIITA
jgi:hypothetical protein